MEGWEKDPKKAAALLGEMHEEEPYDDEDDQFEDRLDEIYGRHVSDEERQSALNLPWRPAVRMGLAVFCDRYRCAPRFAEIALLSYYTNLDKTMCRILIEEGCLDAVEKELRAARRECVPQPEPEPEHEGFLGWLSELIRPRSRARA